VRGRGKGGEEFGMDTYVNQTTTKMLSTSSHILDVTRTGAFASKSVQCELAEKIFVDLAALGA
jgi:hypothetical protein